MPRIHLTTAALTTAALTTAAALFAAAGPAARGAVLVPGDLVTVEVTAANTPLATGGDVPNDPVQLQQFTPAGVAVPGSVAPLTTATGAQLVLPNTSDHDGQLTVSTTGNVLTTAAYLTTPNPTDGLAANVDTAANAPRVIAVVSPNGSVDTSTQLTGSSDYNAVSIRQVTSINGTQFYTSGNGLKPAIGSADIGGLRYATLGGTSTTSLNPSNDIDVRTTTVFNGQLYGASGSSNNPTAGHTTFTLGTGLPTPATAPAAFTALAKTGGGSVAGNQSPTFVTLADGDVLLYTSDSTAGGLDKSVYVPATKTWTADGTVTLSGIEDLAATATGNSVTLYASTASAIDTLTDTADTGPDNGTFTTLITAPTGDQFRGLAIAPAAVPEPAGLAVLALAAVPALARRRRRA